MRVELVTRHCSGTVTLICQIKQTHLYLYWHIPTYIYLYTQVYISIYRYRYIYLSIFVCYLDISTWVRPRSSVYKYVCAMCVVQPRQHRRPRPGRPKPRARRTTPPQWSARRPPPPLRMSNYVRKNMSYAWNVFVKKATSVKNEMSNCKFCEGKCMSDHVKGK